MPQDDLTSDGDWEFSDFAVSAQEIEQLRGLNLPKQGYYEDVENYHPLSIRNINEITDILLHRGIQVVIMQYLSFRN